MRRTLATLLLVSAVDLGHPFVLLGPHTHSALKPLSMRPDDDQDLETKFEKWEESLEKKIEKWEEFHKELELRNQHQDVFNIIMFAKLTKQRGSLDAIVGAFCATPGKTVHALLEESVQMSVTRMLHDGNHIPSPIQKTLLHQSTQFAHVLLKKMLFGDEDGTEADDKNFCISKTMALGRDEILEKIGLGILRGMEAFIYGIEENHHGDLLYHDDLRNEIFFDDLYCCDPSACDSEDSKLFTEKEMADLRSSMASYNSGAQDLETGFDEVVSAMETAGLKYAGNDELQCSKEQ